MSISQDWDLDEILKHSRTLKIDDDIAIKKYYQIFQYLRTQEEYRDECKRTECAVYRTKNWLNAYANEVKK